MDSHQAFKSRSQEIARNFLQTVVVVDDRPAFRDAQLQEQPTSIVEPSTILDAVSDANIVKPQKSKQDETIKNEVTSRILDDAGTLNITTANLNDGEDKHGIDIKALMDAFAVKGLLCGILSPQKGESDIIPKTVKVAHRADIVILDWYLVGTRSDTALEILAHIIEQDENRRLRLISIYTGQPYLKDVVAKVKERLVETIKRKNRSYPLKTEGDFTLQAGPIRVCIFAKPNAPIPKEQKVFRERVVSESELPDRLISEFAMMTAGLVSNVALQSLCVLRERTHELLGRLHPLLDAPFLSHRCLLPHPEEAADHIGNIVASEIANILASARAGDISGTVATNEWIVAKPNQKWQLSMPGGNKNDLTSDQVLELLHVGIDKSTKLQELLDQLEALEPIVDRKYEKNKLHRKLTELFSTASLARSLDFEFARLSSMSSFRTKDGISDSMQQPVLRLGTVLQLLCENTYWLCLQPVCDSNRIEDKRRFPLIKLRKVDASNAFRIVAINLSGEDVRLQPILKAHELDNVSFLATKDTGVIIATVQENEFHFTSEKDGDYIWLGNLKPEQAQRIANEFSSQMCRVGLDESEWLRRSAQ